jgi:hypothetical protein
MPGKTYFQGHPCTFLVDGELWRIMTCLFLSRWAATQLRAVLAHLHAPPWYFPVPRHNHAHWAQVRVARASLPAAAAAPDGGRQHGPSRASAAVGGGRGARLLGAWRRRQPRGPAGAQQLITRMTSVTGRAAVQRNPAHAAGAAVTSAGCGSSNVGHAWPALPAWPRPDMRNSHDRNTRRHAHQLSLIVPC